ncbi:MAG TPA: bifunctional nicotinamidase/pyrazinamidase [Stellaceae bacterium]|nr:bifunctional nicotinamidase/pyrazinamidase [Stellaceae bacterium]
MTVAIDPEVDVLLVVDVQPDFMPGGALAVPEGDEVVPVINRLLIGPFRHAVTTQDWHPADHISFASRHVGKQPFQEIDLPYGRQTLWPDHCVQGTPGAALHPSLDQRRIELVVRKGFRRAIDSYSAFRENDRRTATGLEAWIRARGFRRVFVTGLARGYCVDCSAEDAAAAGFATFVIEDACRGITPEATEAGTARLLAAGVTLLRSDALRS